MPSRKLVRGMDYVKKVPDNPATPGFGPGSEFGFKNPLHFFGFLLPTPKTDPNQARHTLGFGNPAPLRQKNPLQFFRLQPRLGPLPAVLAS